MSFVSTIAIIFSVIAALLLCCAVALMLSCRKWCKKRNASHAALSTAPSPTPATTVASAPPAYSPTSSSDYIPFSVGANAVGATPVMAVAQVQPCLSSRCRPPPPYATIHCTERADEWQHNIGPLNH
jgi:hypothetical protein